MGRDLIEMTLWRRRQSQQNLSDKIASPRVSSLLSVIVEKKSAVYSEKLVKTMAAQLILLLLAIPVLINGLGKNSRVGDNEY